MRRYRRFVMRRPFSCLKNCLLLSISVLTLALGASAQQKTAPPKQAPAKNAAVVKPKIRTITAFINLDPAQYQQQVAETLEMLRRAKTIFESRGYEVETIRIATQPFPEYTKGMTTQQAVAFFKRYDALAEKEKFAAGNGPAHLNTDDIETPDDLLAGIICAAQQNLGSLLVSARNGRCWEATVGTA